MRSAIPFVAGGGASDNTGGAGSAVAFGIAAVTTSGAGFAGSGCDGDSATDGLGGVGLAMSSTVDVEVAMLSAR